jgi:phage terminase large subunit
MINVNFSPPEKLFFFYSQKARYKIALGGRGSGKSWAVADCLVLKAVEEKHRILCTRAYQNSILESVHALLVGSINRLGLQAFFEVTKTSIKTKHRGRSDLESEFIFKGLQNNIDEIKSMEGITICWVEEAHSIDAFGWDTLIPTIRYTGSEIWVTFNPRDVNDATYRYFVAEPRPDSIVVKVNYYDNPFFKQTALVAEMEYCKQHDYEKYKHVWLGEPKAQSDALVFKNWKIEAFDDAPIDAVYQKRRFFGVDFGWNDPNVAIRSYIIGNKLYISHEIYKSHILMDEFARLMEDTIPDIRNPRFSIYGDSSRPDLINELYRKYGFRNIASVKKTTKTDDPLDKMKDRNYVKAGVDFLKSFEIIIHPRCKNFIEEARNYKWKSELDASGENLIILDELEAGFDHGFDSLRYGLSPLFLKRKSTMADIARSIIAKKALNS